MAAPSVTLFGPVDALVGPYVEYVVLALVVLNLVTRKLAHDSHVRQAAEGADELAHHPAHVASSGLAVVGSFYYTTLSQHSGIVLSMFVVGMVLADVFEFEARRVEAENGLGVESPKGALTISAFALVYAAYVSFFFLVEPYWSQIV